MHEHRLSPPLGFCTECSDRIMKGTGCFMAFAQPDGSQFVHAYCAHQEAGAYRLRGQGMPDHWTIYAPIDVCSWLSSLPLVIKFHAAHARQRAAKALTEAPRVDISHG